MVTHLFARRVGWLAMMIALPPSCMAFTTAKTGIAGDVTSSNRNMVPVLFDLKLCLVEYTIDYS